MPTIRLHQHRPFECIALLLQDGGALGACQAGVYEALAEANLWPDCVAGTSNGRNQTPRLSPAIPERTG